MQPVCQHLVLLSPRQAQKVGLRRVQAFYESCYLLAFLQQLWNEPRKEERESEKTPTMPGVMYLKYLKVTGYGDDSQGKVEYAVRLGIGGYRVVRFD